MAKYLVIVESPAKAKTINKFLGSNYHVVASNGHVRDLPKSRLGIDVEDDYEPKYITIRGKGDILAMLRKEAKKADKIYLATDPDREGEAISWHLATALKLDEAHTNRITFNEITKNAVKTAIKHPRKIDMDLVDAQQARRMLDRMVGYRISPLLWSKVKRGLSAGRVQSVALRLICDREQEIDAFIPKEYWSLDAVLNVSGEKKPLTAKFYGKKKEKIEIHSQEELNAITDALKDAAYQIVDIKTGERTRKAPVPFTTSTLQQEASKQLNFSTQKTMRLAQQLYEGVDIQGLGTVGLITYLRTDSIRISEEADSNARNFIAENYGQEYVAAAPKTAESGKKIQDAHEAIRPTYLDQLPVKVKESLSRDQFRLYQLIWNRFVASRMKEAVYETTNIKIEAAGYLFTVSTSRLAFEGFMSVYKPDDEKAENNVLARKINKDSQLSFKDFDAKVEECYIDPSAIDRLVPSTLEGCVVRISDMIAYIGKDRQDAIKTKLIDSESVFAESEIGKYNAAIINNLIVNIVENSYGKDFIQLDEKHYQALKNSKKDNFRVIYQNSKISDVYDKTIEPMFEEIYNKLLYDLKNDIKSSPIFKHHIELIDYSNRFSGYEYTKNSDFNDIVTDYIASMTDDYFIDLYEYLFNNLSM